LTRNEERAKPAYSVQRSALRQGSESAGSAGWRGQRVSGLASQRVGEAHICRHWRDLGWRNSHSASAKNAETRMGPAFASEDTESPGSGRVARGRAEWFQIGSARVLRVGAKREARCPSSTQRVCFLLWGEPGRGLRRVGEVVSSPGFVRCGRPIHPITPACRGFFGGTDSSSTSPPDTPTVKMHQAVSTDSGFRSGISHGIGKKECRSFDSPPAILLREQRAQRIRLARSG
jgi:hypothetical protein